MHVDDGLAGSTSMEFLNFIKGEIKKAFGIKDLGPLRIFLSVQFERNLETHELWIHQEMFINSLLLEYELTHCNAVKTPLDRDHPLGLSTDLHAPVADLTRSFQRLVGSLLFLQVCSRPDISFAVLLLSQHCSSPEPRHFAAAKHVLRYLKGTCSYRLHYGGRVVTSLSPASLMPTGLVTRKTGRLPPALYGHSVEVPSAGQQRNKTASLCQLPKLNVLPSRGLFRRDSGFASLLPSSKSIVHRPLSSPLTTMG